MHLQTLVKLALGYHPNHTTMHDGGQDDGDGPPPDLRGWSEASASISRALLKQSQETVDVCMEELRKVCACVCVWLAPTCLDPRTP
jgi:hypothetical protein